MKTYPSIPYYKDFIGKECIGFVKEDGSNIRMSWTKKQGWHKFGTRRHLFDHTHPVFGPAIDFFKENLADEIDKVIRDNKAYRGVNEVTVFAEYFGPSSFAGDHVPDEPKQLILFDVNPTKKGFVSPRDFVNHFGHLQYSAEVLYEGILTQELVQSVIDGELPVQEGIVVKGNSGHNLWMAKIKTAKWIEQVKNNFPQNWRSFHDEN